MKNKNKFQAQLQVCIDTLILPVAMFHAEEQADVSSLNTLSSLARQKILLPKYSSLGIPVRLVPVVL